MDLCVINWGYIKDIIVTVIGAGVPSFVAWRVYIGWRFQKSSEVLANESKSGAKSILEACHTLFEINNSLRLKPNKDIKEKLIRDITFFENIHKKIFRDLLFINEGVDEERLYNLILKYNECYADMMLVLKVEIKIYGLKSESKTQEYYENFINSTKDINRILMNYALYKKDIKFKGS